MGATELESNTNTMANVLMPIRHCHVIIAMQYLRYLKLLPAHHYARAAFDDACLLHAEKTSSILGWGHCPCTLSPSSPCCPEACAPRGPESIRELIAEVEASLGEKRVVGVLAKYAFNVLSIFDAVKVYLQLELLWPTGLSP